MGLITSSRPFYVAWTCKYGQINDYRYVIIDRWASGHATSYFWRPEFHRVDADLNQNHTNCSVTRCTSLSQAASIKQSAHSSVTESGVHMRASLFHASRPWSLNSAKNEARSELKPRLKKTKRWWKRQISGNLDCIPPPSSSARSESPRTSVDNISHTSQNTLGFSDGVKLHFKSNDGK